MQKNILVTGATGNIGSALLPLLAGSTHKIWAGSTKGQTLQGTPGRAIDFLNPVALNQAFEGIQTLFVVIPLHPQMVLMATNVANAAKAAGVTHIVRVSGAGADPQSPVAVARVQGEIDAQLKNSGIRCTFLQPKNFMQNYIPFYPQFIQQVSPGKNNHFHLIYLLHLLH